jgi:hypothetical protein
MQKKLLITASFIATFALGYAEKSFITPPHDEQPLKKATGIGGIFFKCKAPKKVWAWYQTHPGLITNEYGAVIEWRQGTTQKGQANGARSTKKPATFCLLPKFLCSVTGWPTPMRCFYSSAKTL